MGQTCFYQLYFSSEFLLEILPCSETNIQGNFPITLSKKVRLLNNSVRPSLRFFSGQAVCRGRAVVCADENFTPTQFKFHNVRFTYFNNITRFLYNTLNHLGRKLAFLMPMVLCFLLFHKSYGQADSVKLLDRQGSPASNSHATTPGKDMGDVWHGIFRSRSASPDSEALASAAPDSEVQVSASPAARERRDKRAHFTFLPAAGYTLQTGFAGVISGNIAFHTDGTANNKLSSINTSITYSQYKQTIFPFQANIWTKGNRYNLITEIRYIDYPSAVFGLGGRTDPNKGYTINFSGIKLHQTVMRSVSDDLYLGIGYYYDKFSNIKAIDKVTRTVNQQMSKELGKKETASGVALRFLYDTRLNQINPQQGVCYDITYRSSQRSWGSDSNWNSLQIDARAYARFPRGSRNVLAFWMLDWTTSNGVPPYLLLPSTGWDNSYNTGRGYIQGRFRGKTMVYFESEYRFGISRNGLIGGVAFLNLQNFSNDLSAQYSRVFPGYGAGLRVKLNKYSDTNLCIDYAFGDNGSRGFFVNLGEVF